MSDQIASDIRLHNALNCAATTSLSHWECNIIATFQNVCDTVAAFCVEGTSSSIVHKGIPHLPPGLLLARIYAISRHNLYIVSAVTLIFVMNICGNLRYSKGWETNMHADTKHVATALTTLSLLYDTCVLVITIHYTWIAVRERQAITHPNRSASISGLVFQQGVVRFL
ncbi:hypothetical protein BU17DRAFT_68570 [Hysterangium stoloniferum]|nr:hypothetical protein BU17DRAFT_68570 [Hysterangium stoloniferum]